MRMPQSPTSPDRRTRPRHGLLRTRRFGPQAGTTTAEYAIGTLAACAFAAVLYKIITSGSVSGMLTGIIHKALGSAG